MPQSTYQITKNKYRKMMMDEQLYNKTMDGLRQMFRSRHGIDAKNTTFSIQADGVDVRLSTKVKSNMNVAVEDWMAEMA